MKKYLVLFVFLFIVSYSYADRITKAEASKVATNFYFERAGQNSIINYQDIAIDNIVDINDAGHCLIYAVNIYGGGFVLISATDRVKPVLGYALNGHYTGHGLPPQFSGWLERYKEQVTDAIDRQLEPTDEIKNEWKRLLSADPDVLLNLKNVTSVEPLLTTTWDQGSYYNEACPADPQGPGGHCYAGCVATTLGQITNYFRWPDTGTGSYTYACPPYGTLTGDFENTTYEWDMMGTALTRSNDAVALLLHHLGIACDMVYGPNGSGMYNHKAAYALRTFFKYSPETQYVYRDSTTMDWDSLIITHIDKKIPLYYAGWSVPNINGHAFVLDGYQPGNYYHFNWGWSGSYDGYFYTDNLNPGGSNFNLAQELVINAYPDTINYAYPYYCQGDKVLNSLDGTIGDGSGPLDDYLPGAECSWLIAPDDSVNNITLDFLHFNTAAGDFLTIYDGETSSAPVLGSYYGPDIPAQISSSGDKVLLQFSSSSEGEGFLISYESELPVYCSGTTMLNEQSGYISDGSGPRDYHNGSQCIWMIAPPGASEVSISFSSFHTEAENDVLQIYDMDTQQELASYSGDIDPDPVTSPSGKMFITFSTNSSITAPGWEAYYETDLVKVEERTSLSELNIFPNPASSTIAVSWTSFFKSDISLAISDMNGRELINETLTSAIGNNNAKINVSSLNEGIYLLKLNNGQDVMYHKLVIQF